MSEVISDYAGHDKKTYKKLNKKGLAYGSEYFSQPMPTEEAVGAFKVIKYGSPSQFVGDVSKEAGKIAFKESVGAGKFVAKDAANVSEVAFKGALKGASKDAFGDGTGSKVINTVDAAERVAKHRHKKAVAHRKAELKEKRNFSRKVMDEEYKKALANGNFKQLEENLKAADKNFNASKIIMKSGPADSHEAYKAFRKKASQKKFARKIYKKYHKTPVTKIKDGMVTKGGKAISAVQHAILELVKKPYVWLIAGIVLIIIMILNIIMMIFGSLISSEQGAGLSSTYLSEDSEIYACEDYYLNREEELKEWLDNIEVNYPGYDEYDYSDVASIEHNPYVIASYLNSLKHEPFTAGEVEGDMDTFFETQYLWYTDDEWVDREVTDYDEYGNPDGSHIEHIHVLHVHIKNKGEVATAYSLLDTESGQRFSAQVSIKGQKPYLWDGYNIDDTNGINAGTRSEYKLPPSILRDDPAFARLYSVGADLIGTPYVWGGTTPDGFDCSGFVSYVYTESGYAYMPTLTSQQIYDRCERLDPDDVRPGDLIFLTGTYATTNDVTHVAIYIGNNMVLNCGDPVKYCNITTGWWKRHFYAYGRYLG